MHLVFFSPWYFYLAPIVASIPVLIHLLNRAKRRKVVFSSVYIFEEILRNSRRELSLKRWQRILLLLSRSLILFFLALLLAGPWLSSVGSGRNNNDNEERNFVFLFDVSGSRSVALPFVGGRNDKGERNFTNLDNDKKIALRLVELLQRKLPYDFRLGILSYTREIEGPMSSGLSDSGVISDYKKIFSDERKIMVTQKGTSHSKGIASAINIIEENNHKQKKNIRDTIFWFTDLAAHGFRDDRGIAADGKVANFSSDNKTPDILLPDGVNLVVISGDNTKNRYPNLAIQGVETDKVKGSQGFFDVLVRSYDFKGSAFLRLYWILDLDGKGEEKNEKIVFDMPVHIKENQINRIRCFLPPSVIMSFSSEESNFQNVSSLRIMPYLFRIEVKGDEFYLADNSYYFRLNDLESGFNSGRKEGQLNVLIVDGNPEPGRLSNVFYIESALKASDIVGAVRTITSGDFIKGWDVSYGREFFSYDAIVFSDFWPDIPYIDANTDNIDSLKNFCKRYLENKGRVVIFFPGERLNLLNSDSLQSSNIIDVNGVRFYPSGKDGNFPTRFSGENRRVDLKIDKNIFEEILGFKKSEEFDWGVSINQLHTVSCDEEGFLTLASAGEDNMPFILCKRQGEGVFFFINTTSNRRWSDFCSKAVFAVLIEKMTGAGSIIKGDGFGGDVYGFVGESPKIGNNDYSKLFYYDDGKMISLGVPAQKAGIYPIKSDEAKRNFYFVNFPPDESDLSVLDEKEVLKRIKRGKNSNIYFVRYDAESTLKSAGGSDGSLSSENNKEISQVVSKALTFAVGKDIKKEIVAVILLLLIFENILSGGVFFLKKKS